MDVFHVLITGQDLGHSIEIGGKDISNYVTEVAHPLQDESLPTLTFTDFVLNRQAIVSVDEGTAEVLKLLGWTPPGEEK